jgi:hypothetical protein
MLSRIFGTKMDDVIGGWKNYVLYNLCYSSSIIRMIRSMKMRLAEHVRPHVGGA